MSMDTDDDKAHARSELVEQFERRGHFFQVRLRDAMTNKVLISRQFVEKRFGYVQVDYLGFYIGQMVPYLA